MMATLTTAALADGTDHLTVRCRDAIRKARQIPITMITEYLLNPVHESTPRTSWLSFWRDSSRPLSVTCR